MTDKEIGKTVREIAERGKHADVYINKDGIVIVEISKKVVKSDRKGK